MQTVSEYIRGDTQAQTPARNLAHLSDEALLALCSRADENALGELYDRYGRVDLEHPAAEGGTRSRELPREREGGRREAERLEILLAARAELRMTLERLCLVRVERIEHVGRSLVVHHRKYGAI